MYLMWLAQKFHKETKKEERHEVWVDLKYNVPAEPWFDQKMSETIFHH